MEVRKGWNGATGGRGWACARRRRSVAMKKGALEREGDGGPPRERDWERRGGGGRDPRWAGGEGEGRTRGAAAGWPDIGHQRRRAGGHQSTRAVQGDGRRRSAGVAAAASGAQGGPCCRGPRRAYSDNSGARPDRGAEAAR